MITKQEIDKMTDKEAMIAELRDILGQLAMFNCSTYTEENFKNTINFFNHQSRLGIRLLDKIAEKDIMHW